jgi:hypothetical protein
MRKKNEEIGWEKERIEGIASLPTVEFIGGHIVYQTGLVAETPWAASWPAFALNWCFHCQRLTTNVYYH